MEYAQFITQAIERTARPAELLFGKIISLAEIFEIVKKIIQKLSSVWEKTFPLNFRIIANLFLFGNS